MLASAVGALLIVIYQTRSGGGAGGGFFGVLSTLVFFYCWLEGPRKTADTLSEEKREGTLGLLFLTDLTGLDVVLGKLAANSVRSLQGFLAITPVLSIGLILGGLTLGQFWRTILTLLATMLFSLSIGLLISSFSRNSTRAVGGTLAALFLVTWPPVALGKASFFAGLSQWTTLVSLVSPWQALVLVPDTAYRVLPVDFWACIGALFGISAAALALASRIVPRAWQDKPATQTKAAARPFMARAKADPEREAKRRARLLDINPVLWLPFRSNTGRSRFWAQAAFAVFAAPAIYESATSPSLSVGWSPLMILPAFAFRLWFAYEASNTIAEAKRNGALEFILSTPLKVEDLIRGQILALKRVFLWPALAIIGSQLVAIAIAGANAWTRNQPDMLLGIGYSIYWLVSFATRIVSMTYAGMLMGLTQKNPTRAFFATAGLGILAPVFLFCAPNPLIDFAIIRFCAPRLRIQFRALAAGQTAPPPPMARFFGRQPQPPYLARR